MKKHIYGILIILISFSGLSSYASTELNKKPKTEKVVAEEAKVMINRLNEIKSMDKTGLSKTEKKELRKEVRTLKTNLTSLGNGVYLSAGAIVVILLLLIIIF
jgi:hypothetical protein